MSLKLLLILLQHQKGGEVIRGTPFPLLAVGQLQEKKCNSTQNNRLIFTNLAKGKALSWAIATIMTTLGTDGSNKKMKLLKIDYTCSCIEVF